MKNKILIIVGMHRSGTSLLANWLYNSGLFLGEKLMLNRFDNPAGHYEDMEVVSVHEFDLMLKNLNTTGLYLKNDKPLFFEKQTIDKIDHLTASRNKFNIWGWKDPRGTLYIFHWKKLFPKLLCIAPFRNYNLVVSSLLKRYHKQLANKKYLKNNMKLILWNIEKKRQLKSFVNAWKIYNSLLIAYWYKYPKECLIYNAENFLLATQKIKVFLEFHNIKLNFMQPEKIFQRQLLTVDPIVELRNRNDILKIWEELKKIELNSVFQ